ncbi:hypothetical protein U1Q18_010150 [Sarracenia purpurea var. burkii]
MYWRSKQEKALGLSCVYLCNRKERGTRSFGLRDIGQIWIVGEQESRRFGECKRVGRCREDKSHLFAVVVPMFLGTNSGWISVFPIKHKSPFDDDLRVRFRWNFRPDSLDSYCSI